MDNKELYNRAFSHVKAPDRLKTEVRKMTYNKSKTVAPRRTVIIIAAALLLAVTALALTYGLWNPKAAEMFGVDEATQSMLLDSNVASTLDISDSDNGITITARQIVVDQRGFFVLFEVNSDDPEFLSYPVSPFFDFYMDDGSEDLIIGGRGSWADGNSYLKDDQTWSYADTMYFYWWIHTEDGVDPSGHTVTFTVDKFIDGNIQADDRTCWTGHIELTIPLDYNTNTVERYSTDLDVPVKGGEIHISEVTVSPINVCVYYSGQRQDFISVSAVTYADGATVEVSGGGTFYEWEDGFISLSSSESGIIPSGEAVSVTLRLAGDGEPVYYEVPLE